MCTRHPMLRLNLPSCLRHLKQWPHHRPHRTRVACIQESQYQSDSFVGLRKNFARSGPAKRQPPASNQHSGAAYVLSALPDHSCIPSPCCMHAHTPHVTQTLGVWMGGCREWAYSTAGSRHQGGNMAIYGPKGTWKGQRACRRVALEHSCHPIPPQARVAFMWPRHGTASSGILGTASASCPMLVPRAPDSKSLPVLMPSHL